MFEKEAKKHREEFITAYISGGGEMKAADMIGMQKEQSYKDGAEFGYNKAFVEADKNLKAIVTDFNKANKWHYVKDGDLPKENKICLLYLGRSFNPTTGWIDNDIWYFEDNRKNSVWQTKVIAWKEITPPKEIKEND